MNQETYSRYPEPGLSKKETLQITLSDAAQCLGECQAILKEIVTKMNGATPETADKSSLNPIGGINGVALDIRNRAQQIRSVLGTLAGEL